MFDFWNQRVHCPRHLWYNDVRNFKVQRTLGKGTNQQCVLPCWPRLQCGNRRKSIQCLSYSCLEGLLRTQHWNPEHPLRLAPKDQWYWIKYYISSCSMPSKVIIWSIFSNLTQFQGQAIGRYTERENNRSLTEDMLHHCKQRGLMGFKRSHGLHQHLLQIVRTAFSVWHKLRGNTNEQYIRAMQRDCKHWVWIWSTI